MIRNSNIIELGIINSNVGAHSNEKFYSLTQDMSYVADTHFKIIERDGAVFLYGVKPRTALYYMKKTYEHGYPELKFLHVV